MHCPFPCPPLPFLAWEPPLWRIVMKPRIHPMLKATAAIALCTIGAIALYATALPHYLITNNDRSLGNSATFYAIAGDGSLTEVAAVNTGGKGNDGIGAVALKRLSVLSDSRHSCVYVADANTGDVAAISIGSLKLSGNFPASSTDTGTYGVGVANNGTYVYANFTGSETLATYQISTGCKLTFLGDTPAAGLKGGFIIDMYAHDNLLVASFTDGSIGSYNISGGKPVANGDLQLSTGNIQDGNYPAGVDITSDGHYAIFGGGMSPELVEVSDISSGKLTPTVVYSNLGSGSGGNAIRLSPDETLLYFSDFSSSQVTATHFDKTTGTVSPGCISSALKGNSFEAGLATANAFGTGGTLYVAEPDSRIGIVSVGESGSDCTLTESPDSPVYDSKTITVESIGTFPPRSF